MLRYGDRARGKVITVINRYVPPRYSSREAKLKLWYSSEVVGRPLAALLANDGARVLSVDIDCMSFQTTNPCQIDLTPIAIQEFSKRPSSSASKTNPHHVTSPTDLSLTDCLSISDVVISAVPVDSYKVPTKALKDGCVCVNVAGEKNFEADVRERVSCTFSSKSADLVCW